MGLSDPSYRKRSREATDFVDGEAAQAVAFDGPLLGSGRSLKGAVTRQMAMFFCIQKIIHASLFSGTFLYSIGRYSLGPGRRRKWDPSWKRPGDAVAVSDVGSHLSRELHDGRNPSPPLDG